MEAEWSDEELYYAIPLDMLINKGNLEPNVNAAFALIFSLQGDMSYIGGSESTLSRVRRTGQNTYIRALERKIEWPSKDYGQRPVQEQEPVYTTLDDAFSNVVHSMSQITRQCKEIETLRKYLKYKAEVAGLDPSILELDMRKKDPSENRPIVKPRYYKSHPPKNAQSKEACHCNRFHTSAYTTVKSRNPLQRSEDINIVVNPGSYAISAGRWGTVQQQSHVVHMQDGDTVELDFVL